MLAIAMQTRKYTTLLGLSSRKTILRLRVIIIYQQTHPLLVGTVYLYGDYRSFSDDIVIS